MYKSKGNNRPYPNNMSKETKRTIKAMTLMAVIVLPILTLLHVNMFMCYGFEESALCLVK